jgi:hypothetical protein
MPKGSKPGERRGGREKGTPNRATVEREIRARTGVANAVSSGLMPLDVILCRMREVALPNGLMPTDDQVSAAIAAAPYLHARLSAVAYQKPPSRSRVDVSVLTSEERRMLLGAIRRGLIRQDHGGIKQVEGEVEE